MGVKVFDGEILHLVEQVAAYRVERAVRYFYHKLAVNQGRQNADRVNASHDRDHLNKRDEIRRGDLFADQRRNALVQQGLYEIRTRNIGGRTDQNKEQDGKKPEFLLENIPGNPGKGLANILGLCSGCIVSWSRHQTATPFCCDS